VWKTMVEKDLIKIFGIDSIELREFKKLNFFYKPRHRTLGSNFTREDRQIFTRNLDSLVKSLNSYILGIKETVDDKKISIDQSHSHTPNKIFISHASSDSRIVEEIIDLLENIGLGSNQVFCSSIEGYGINLGDNFLEAIKSEINDSVLVLFILSNNFYSSPICLCEMGATWVMSTQHIPILIPPFDFANIRGVIPFTQGFKINDAKKWNLLKQQLETAFKLNPLNLSTWERKRNKAMLIIDDIISN
ncbi:MAG: hypothetical protein JWR09_923, partial [Mucilaginibacter sp.]|nr:hypothetical protein [Mucilaginibacter sp.]